MSMLQPSQRAMEIAKGLARTGRGSFDVRRFQTWLRVWATSGGFYWISVDGETLLRGDDLKSAEELQRSFADVMARAGVARYSGPPSGAAPVG